MVLVTERYNIFLFMPGTEQILVSKHNPGVILFHCDTQLVFEQLKTRRNDPRAFCFPIDSPILPPQPYKDSANTVKHNM